MYNGINYTSPSVEDKGRKLFDMHSRATYICCAQILSLVGANKSRKNEKFVVIGMKQAHPQSTIPTYTPLVPM